MKNSFKILACVSSFLLLSSFSRVPTDRYEDLLDQYLIEQGYETIEGHSCLNDTVQPDCFKKILNCHSEVRTIGEIGFNAGHSSVVFLEASSNVMVYSFDIMNHDYVHDGKAFIDYHFPNRHLLIEGNSTDSVPRFHEENSSLKFDLIFLDGGHGYEVALTDIKNMRNFAHENTILIIDDLMIPTVRKAYDECVNIGLITKGKISRSKHKAWSVGRYIFN